jgi:hypothetical protein
MFGKAACFEIRTGRDFSQSVFVKKTNAIAGLLDEAEWTNWMLSKTYPCAVHSFRMRSI